MKKAIINTGYSKLISVVNIRNKTICKSRIQITNTNNIIITLYTKYNPQTYIKLNK